ncbi:hypothetical protein DV737_g1500, partial [Chaetothyriales sp. CBS 132003]
MSANHSRFYGSVAGVDFVDLVESVVDASGASNGVFNMVTAELSNAGTSPSTQLSPSRIPERHVAKQLVAVYFQHWHVTFPLLYRPAFLDLVEAVYDDPSFYGQNPAAAFAFDIILALAICERWDDARSSCEIFSRLSNGAIKELLKAQGLRNDSLNTIQVAPSVSNQGVIPLDPVYETPRSEWNGSDGVLRGLSRASVEQVACSDHQQQENAYEFQQLFQDMQTSLYDQSFDGSNEVFFGFDKDWFDQTQ